jgi:hypothetical protein
MFTRYTALVCLLTPAKRVLGFFLLPHPFPVRCRYCSALSLSAPTPFPHYSPMDARSFSSAADAKSTNHTINGSSISLSPTFSTATTTNGDHGQGSNDSDTPGSSSTTAPPPPQAWDPTSVLSIDPTDVDIVQVDTDDEIEDAQAKEENAADLLQRLPFVRMFRGSANYIANHRNTLAVYHLRKYRLSICFCRAT